MQECKSQGLSGARLYVLTYLQLSRLKKLEIFVNTWERVKNLVVKAGN